MVPKDLHLENGAALALLQGWFGPAAAAAAAARMTSAALVAVALAHEAGLGPASRWAPYIASLPAVPPGPWLLPAAQLPAAAEAAVAAHSGQEVAEWVWAAEVYRRGVEEEVRCACEALADAAAAAAAADTGGPAARITPESLTWALGHVQSRSLGTAGSSGLGESPWAPTAAMLCASQWRAQPQRACSTLKQPVPCWATTPCVAGAL